MEEDHGALLARIEAEAGAVAQALERLAAAVAGLPATAARHLADESFRWARANVERALFHAFRSRDERRRQIERDRAHRQRRAGAAEQEAA